MHQTLFVVDAFFKRYHGFRAANAFDIINLKNDVLRMRSILSTDFTKDIELSCEEWDIWEAICTRLIVSAHSQPQVFVHRDFHSFNLLKTEQNSPGIIDFQDAVVGPITYDLVSLIWDRYITWPRDRVENWLDTFRRQVSSDTDAATWLRWCDWMALQRNLKVPACGIQGLVDSQLSAVRIQPPHRPCHHLPR